MNFTVSGTSQHKKALQCVGTIASSQYTLASILRFFCDNPHEIGGDFRAYVTECLPIGSRTAYVYVQALRDIEKAFPRSGRGHRVDVIKACGGITAVRRYLLAGHVSIAAIVKARKSKHAPKTNALQVRNKSQYNRVMALCENYYGMTTRQNGRVTGKESAIDSMLAEWLPIIENYNATDVAAIMGSTS